LSRQDAWAALYRTARGTPSPSSLGFKGVYSLFTSRLLFWVLVQLQCHWRGADRCHRQKQEEHPRPAKADPRAHQCFRPFQFRYSHPNFLSLLPTSRVCGLWTLSLQASPPVSNLLIGLVRGRRLYKHGGEYGHRKSGCYCASAHQAHSRIAEQLGICSWTYERNVGISRSCSGCLCGMARGGEWSEPSMNV
jgi:hypothetical protein